jgi:hypothetical protein
MNADERARKIIAPWVDELGPMTEDALERAIATAIREAEAAAIERAADIVADKLRDAQSTAHTLRHRLAGRSRSETFLPGSLAPELLRRSEEALAELTDAINEAIRALATPSSPEEK